LPLAEVLPPPTSTLMLSLLPPVSTIALMPLSAPTEPAVTVPPVLMLMALTVLLPTPAPLPAA